jgi:hypothetical protein
MSWAVFRMSRMSLKDGGTKRLDEIERLLSWYLNELPRGRGVKKVPTVGTSNLSLDCPWSPTFWWATKLIVSTAQLRD